MFWTEICKKIMFKMIDSFHQYRPIYVFKDGILDICFFKNIVKKNTWANPSSHLVEWSAQLNPSSWILTHLQETAKYKSLSSLFDPLTPSTH